MPIKKEYHITLIILLAAAVVVGSNFVRMTAAAQNNTSGKGMADESRELEKGDAESVDSFDGELDDGKKGPRFMFKGELKNLFTYHRTNNYLGEMLKYNYIANNYMIGNKRTITTKNLFADMTRLRLSPEFQYNDKITARLDVDNELICSNYGKTTDFTTYWRPSQYNDLLHLTWDLYQNKNYCYRIKIQQAYVKVNVGMFAAIIGRQQIRFGSGKLWNPLDILNPISPTVVESGDDQKGTDAIKLECYPNDKTVITAVVDFKKSNNSIDHMNFQDNNYIGRIKTTVHVVDIAVLGGYVSQRGIAGFDFAAILFDGMLRGSVIASKNQVDPVYFLANAGYEYTFKNGVYVLAEYFFNQKALNYNPKMKAASYLSLSSATNQKVYLQLASQFITINQHYAAFAIGYDIHPLVRSELFIIGDFQGRAIFFCPTIKINAYDNLDFSIGLMGAVTFNDRSSDFSEYRKHYLYTISGRYLF